MNPYRIIDRARPRVAVTKRLSFDCGDFEYAQINQISVDQKVPVEDLLRQIVISFVQEYIHEVKPKADVGRGAE